MVRAIEHLEQYEKYKDDDIVITNLINFRNVGGLLKTREWAAILN